VNQEQVHSDVVKILDDITYDWDLDFGGGIGPGTWLVADLDFGSLDVVELFVALEDHFGRRFPAQTLLMTEDGNYIEDLQVSELVAFVHGILTGEPG